MQYWTCPRCGAHLDPGEKCDCIDIEIKKQRQLRKRQAEAYRLLESESMWEQLELAI